VLIGNTRECWPNFIHAVSSNPVVATVQHPFDTWVVNVINQGIFTASEIPTPDPTSFSDILQDCQPLSESDSDMTSPISITSRFSFDLTPGRHVAMQRLCHAIGLGYYDTEAFTVCHPIYGPWFALYVRDVSVV
jgi:hypothetical protein